MNQCAPQILGNCFIFWSTALCVRWFLVRKFRIERGAARSLQNQLQMPLSPVCAAHGLPSIDIIDENELINACFARGFFLDVVFHLSHCSADRRIPIKSQRSLRLRHLANGIWHDILCNFSAWNGMSTISFRKNWFVACQSIPNVAWTPILPSFSWDVGSYSFQVLYDRRWWHLAIVNTW